MNHTIPSLSLSKSPAKDVDIVVVGLTSVSGSPTVVGALPALNQGYLDTYSVSIQDLALSLGAKDKTESVTVLPPAGAKVVVVGLGDADVTPEGVRRAVGAALRTVSRLPEVEDLRVAVSLELADPELVKAATEGAILGSYSIAKITAEPQTRRVAEISIITAGDAKSLRPAVEAGTTIASGVCRARDWVNAPGNLLFPQSFADEARAYLKDEKIGVEILDEKALEKGGYGGILAVGGGSSRPPRLVRMTYAPRGATYHLALVGKGITFDTGGVDIKPAGQMADMKTDMAGAAAVIAGIKAIATLGLRIKVTAYAALAENMPSGSSYRSADVMTMFGGQTVENYNTDAEGRLVMADAIAKASTEEPDLVVDVATLTGACMVALGLRTGGLMASDDATADRLLDAAEAAGEEFWHLPITEHIRSQLDSDIADMRSGGKQRWGGALVAGAFLQRFVGDGVAWGHLDIAGPGNNNESDYGYTPKGGTGVAVRTLVSLATDLAG